MKKLFLSILFIACAVAMFAVPAKRGVWKTVKLADGTEVKVELRGDEYMRYWQSASGAKYVKAAGQDHYVKADMQQLHQQAVAQRMANPLPYSNMGGESTEGGPHRLGIGDDHPPFVGSYKGLIILVEFTDKKFQEGHTAEYYSHMANDLDFSHPDGFVGSIHDYFLAQSEGQFNLTFDVVGPIQLQHEMEYYGGNNENGGDMRAAAMVREAAQGAAAELGTFAPYDWFGDGEVDQIFVIYAGRGEADGGDENTIWPHRSGINPIRLGSKWVSTYACANELQQGPNGTEIIDGIGAFCHEFSHCLGLPDLYDTGYTGNYGMSFWDIMESGCYLGESFRPCGYSGYEKNYCGWKEPIVLTEDTEVENVQGMSEGGDYYIIYNDAHKNEYYVLENRSQTGWDADLYGAGLLVTHIDFDKSLWSYNMVNTTTSRYNITNDHQRYTPIPADNSFRVQYYNDIAGDVYPYRTNNQLTNYSVPSAMLYNENPDGVKLMSKPITRITKNNDQTISFHFANEVGKNTENPMPEGCLFRETFKNCYGAGGNDGQWGGTGIGVGSLVTDVEGWKDNYGKAGNQCACFGTNKQTGYATTPAISINGNCEFAFLAAPYTGEATKVTLTVMEGDATLETSEFALETRKWKECRTVVSGNGDVKIRIRADKNRFFLDEVYMRTESAAGIDEITMESPKNTNHIFTIDGRFAGNNVEVLSPGLYIRNGKKIILR